MMSPILRTYVNPENNDDTSVPRVFKLVAVEDFAVTAEGTLTSRSD
jgi:hypothetical protein